jgi:dihydroorotate dehydrogenase (fumarate)
MSVDLTTTYLGLALKNPLVVSATPLSARIDWLKRLEDAGAAAAVLPSLFEEQIEYEDFELSGTRERGAESYAEHSPWYPEPAEYRSGPQEYLETIQKATSAVSIPVIASLNGTSEGGWIRYAKLMEEAGADALELNVYYIATDPDQSGEAVERQYLDLVAAVKKSLSIPVAVKIGPYFSAMANMAKRLADAGADGLVLFNRFIQPDINLRTLETSPEMNLSAPAELLVPLRWVAIIRNHVDVSLAVTSGLHDAQGMLKALLVGADVGMVASTIYLHGFAQVRHILDGVEAWMETKEYESVEQLKGSMSREKAPDPAAFARGNYMKSLVTYTGTPI